MADVEIIAAERRDLGGKGTAKRIRKTGRVPGVIYGGKDAPLTISVDSRNFNKTIRTKGFFTRLYDVDLEGVKHRVLPRDVQFHPVTDMPIHFDLLRVSADTRVVVSVPCEFINADKCAGLKRGGVLNVVRYAVELTCKAADIPTSIVVDLAGFDVAQSIHISSVKLPDGVKPTITDRDFTVATIAAPSGLKSEAAEAAATAAA